jgi:light-regulated signal transduction histidine kinase (bacteriophytochrome)
MENLLGNAWKFTRVQSPAIIELGMKQADGQTVYFVRDNGAGFEQAYAEKLFSPFQRLHRMDEFEGTGIGLATVRRIIQRHNGQVWAEGQTGQGAVFYFTLNG